MSQLRLATSIGTTRKTGGIKGSREMTTTKFSIRYSAKSVAMNMEAMDLMFSSENVLNAKVELQA